jgi:hypothetical protein
MHRNHLKLDLTVGKNMDLPFHPQLCSFNPVAYALGVEDTWRVLAASFDVLQFSLHTFYYRWQKCSQPITGF